MVTVTLIVAITVSAISMQASSASAASPNIDGVQAATSSPEPITTSIVLGVAVAMILWKIARKTGWA